ncbi:MAG: glycosyltransferase family 9 protein [Chloroflexota bacterium]|jgi:lipopolysaccharide heptosyltransferase II
MKLPEKWLSVRMWVNVATPDNYSALRYRELDICRCESLRLPFKWGRGGTPCPPGTSWDGANVRGTGPAEPPAPISSGGTAECDAALARATQSPTISNLLYNQSRILIVKLAGIGDLLTAFPAMEALRKAYPQAEITALVTPQTESLLHGSGLVDRVLVLDKYLFDQAGGFLRPRSLVALFQLAKLLRAHSFDVVLLLHHLITWPGIAKYALLMAATGAPLRVGLDDGRGRFLNLSTRDRGFGALHEVDYWLEVVGLLGAANPNPQMRLKWGVEEDQYADDTLSRLALHSNDRLLAVHPGSGSYSTARRWGAGKFADVVDALGEDGLTPLIVAGPGEEAIAQGVIQAAKAKCHLLSGVPSPKHLAAILSRCHLFVGNDSGVMHLAVAAGVPVVAVFGPSNHKAWGPYDPLGRRSRIVRLDLPCSPCLYRGQSLGLRHGCPESRCLEEVTQKMVARAARELLQNMP